VYAVLQAPDGGWNTITGFYNDGAITMIDAVGDPGASMLRASDPMPWYTEAAP